VDHTVAKKVLFPWVFHDFHDFGHFASSLLSKKSGTDVQTNIILGISIENWVESDMFRRFSETSIFFFEKLPVLPPGFLDKVRPNTPEEQ